MAELVNDKIPSLISALRSVNDRMSSRLDRTARDVSARFLSELKRRQPDGSQSLDPLVLAGLSSRDARPSVRMGNTPIARGWIGPKIEAPTQDVRVATVFTSSPHLTYFTKLMGRDRLGTRGGRPIVAKNAKTLAFWWRGSARFPKVVYGHKGFTPRTDFVRDALNAIKPEIRRAQLENISITVEEILDSIS